MNSATTTNDRIEALRTIGRDRGYSPEEIEQRLQQAGLIQAPKGGMGRTLGLGARGMVQGLGNLAGLPFSAAGLAYNAVTGNQPPAMLQPQGGAAADQLGLPTPQTAQERIGVAGTEGVAASLPFMGAGMVGPIAGTALGAGAGMAGQTAAEAGAGPMGQMAASAAVGMGVPIVGMVGAAAIRSAIAGSSARREAARQSMALLQAGNPQAPVTMGQVASGGIGGGLEAGLRKVPGAAGVFQRTLDEQAGVMGERATRIADQVSPGGTPTTAGAALQRGIKEGFIPRFKAASNQLYERAYKLIKPETPVHLSKTAALAAQHDQLAASARPLSDHISSPKVAGIMEDVAATMEANPSGIPFQTVKELRSRLGAMLNGDELVQDINLRDVERLYGALSDDMRTAIAGQGDDALRAWDKASDFWKKGSDHISRYLQPLMDKNTPDIAFRAVMSGTKDGATLLRATMRSLSGEERRLITSTVLRRMGKANPSAQDDVGDVFSPETYLTNWNKLAPEAKGALFEELDPNITKDINRLAQAANLQRQANKRLPNPSGTAPNTAFWAILSSLPMAGAGALQGNMAMATAGASPTIAMGGANLAARAFTNPNMIRWLVKQTKVPFGALTQELAILAKDSEKWDPESRDIAQELSSVFSNVDWRSMLVATAVADATSRRQ